MPYLIAASTQRVTFTPDEVLDSLALAVTDGATPVDLGQPTLDTDAWVLDIQSSDLPAELVGSTLTFTWTLVADTQVRTVIEHYPVTDVAQKDTDLCSVQDVKDMLGIADAQDDREIAAIIAAASDAIRQHCGGPHRFLASATDTTRTYHLDAESYVYPSECSAVTDVVNERGSDMDYTVRTTQDGQRVWLIDLHHSHTGDVAVTGTFGFGVPDDVRHAAVTTVAVWYRRQRGQSEADKYGNLRALPQEAVELLYPHKGE